MSDKNKTTTEGWQPQPEFFGKPLGTSRLNAAQVYMRTCANSLWRATKMSEPDAPLVPRSVRFERLVA